ncbi:hypothetical protein FRX31_009517, partial [Thalictrum thalictroides]
MAARYGFSSAHDYYDLWILNEFHEPESESTYHAATETGTAFANNMLKLLDGQECRLDSKYSKVFLKKRHVPVILIANQLTQSITKPGPFRERTDRKSLPSSTWPSRTGWRKTGPTVPVNTGTLGACGAPTIELREIGLNYGMLDTLAIKLNEIQSEVQSGTVTALHVSPISASVGAPMVLKVVDAKKEKENNK